MHTHSKSVSIWHDTSLDGPNILGTITSSWLVEKPSFPYAYSCHVPIRVPSGGSGSLQTLFPMLGTCLPEFLRGTGILFSDSPMPSCPIPSENSFPSFYLKILFFSLRILYGVFWLFSPLFQLLSCLPPLSYPHSFVSLFSNLALYMLPSLAYLPACSPRLWLL